MNYLEMLVAGSMSVCVYVCKTECHSCLVSLIGAHDSDFEAQSYNVEC
jgi:hypothetical protein